MGRQATAMLVRTLADPAVVEQVLLDCEIVAGETLTPPNPTKDSFK
jgi:DNA-binding LacI/PurR family transcriptional regulator